MANNQHSTTGVISFPQGSSDADALENAGRAAFDAIRRAAAAAEEKTQVAFGLAHRTTLQLRDAEERIAQLEAEIQHARARAQKAEQWLHKIVAEIEHRFDGSSGHRNQQPQQSGAVYSQTGAEVYAPKKRKQEEELIAGLGDLLRARSSA